MLRIPHSFGPLGLRGGGNRDLSTCEEEEGFSFVEDIILPSCSVVFPGMDVLGLSGLSGAGPPGRWWPGLALGPECGASSCLTWEPLPRPAAFGQDPQVIWGTLKSGSAQTHPRTTISRCPPPARYWAPPSPSRLSISSQTASQRGSRCILPLGTPFSSQTSSDMVRA